MVPPSVWVLALNHPKPRVKCQERRGRCSRSIRWETTKNQQILGGFPWFSVGIYPIRWLGIVFLHDFQADVSFESMLQLEPAAEVGPLRKLPGHGGNQQPGIWNAQESASALQKKHWGLLIGKRWKDDKLSKFMAVVSCLICGFNFL